MTAFALVPNFLVERLFKGDIPSLEVNSICERPFFNNTITDNYRQINDFRGYYRRWGAAQSFWLYYQLSDRTIKQQYAQSRDKFQEACEEVFETSLKSQVGCIQGLIRRLLAEVRMRLRLAMNFQIYGISDQYSFHDATAPDAIAILKALKCHSCSHQKLRFTSIRQQSRNFRDCRQLNIATVPSLFKAFSKHSPNRENSLAESVIKIM